MANERQTEVGDESELGKDLNDTADNARLEMERVGYV
jgi:hypothetical protein